MMRQYLIKTFGYNDGANRALLRTILQLPEREEAMRLFSHLITAQDKWINRITRKQEDTALSWFGPVFPAEELEHKWTESVNAWLRFLEEKSDADLLQDVVFHRATDGKALAVNIRDIALQLNYHSIHHRAQINKLISAQGLPVPLTDYIFTVLKEA